MTETARGVTRWDSLERWSPTLFLIAGVLLLGFVVLTGITAFTAALREGPLVGAALVGSGLFGLILAALGLLGLYPRLREPAPRLSRSGFGALIGALLGILAVVGTLAVVGPPEAPGDVPTFIPPVFILSGVLILLGYALFAAASIRTSTPSRRIGYLLAVPVVILCWHYIALAVFGSRPLFDIFDYTVSSAAFLAIGYLLRTEPESTERASQRRRRPAMTETATCTTRGKSLETRRSGITLIVAGWSP